MIRHIRYKGWKLKHNVTSLFGLIHSQCINYVMFDGKSVIIDGRNQ